MLCRGLAITLVLVSPFVVVTHVYSQTEKILQSTSDTIIVNWDTIGSLFAERYATRSGEQGSSRLAEYRFNAASRIIDPELTLRQATAATRRMNTETSDSSGRYSTAKVNRQQTR